MTLTNDSQDVSWDLETLLPVPGKEGVEQLLAEAEARATTLEEARGSVASFDSSQLAAFMTSLGELVELLGRAGNYPMLAFTVATDDPAVGALMASTQERSVAINSRLLFFELEWAAIDDASADAILASPELDFCRHHLAGVRRYRDHLLTEPEEVILSEVSPTGASAWSRLFDELTSAITVESDDGEVALDQALSSLQSPDASERELTAKRITEAIEPGLRTRAYIYNTLAADKSIGDRLRGYDGWIQSRNLANEASDESVAALIEAVVSRYDIPQRWYRTKADLLGVEKLNDWDRMAPIGSDQATFTWEEGKAAVLDAYGSFSSEITSVVERFFDEPWIDAPTRPSKRGGAFCAYTVPSHHPYLLLNWTSRRRDVLTLAHELGHGVHAYLARDQGPFHQGTPLTLAETASVFGETVTFGRLLSSVTDPVERLPLLAEHLEDQIATVFRQVAMNRFEHGVHTARRSDGELSVDRFGELWAESQADLLGDAVELSEGYKTWWSYVPHFIHTPGYVYAYAYGQLLALSIYAQYEAQGEGFVPSYIEMLSAGGSKSPEELGRMVGVDITDPQFWVGGLEIIANLLEETVDAARLASPKSGG